MLQNNLQYDVIVVGLGVMGSSCFYHLNKQGFKVLGIEQFTAPNEKGSSGAETRIIRSIHYEDKEYGQMAKESVRMWKQFQQESPRMVFVESLGVAFAQKGSFILENSNTIENVKNVDVNILQKQFPLFTFPSNTEGVIDSSGGIGYISNAIKSFIELGIKANTNSKVVVKCQFKNYEIQSDQSIKVYTDQEIYYCRKIILSMGMWINKFQNKLDIPYIPLTIQKQTKYWFQTENKQTQLPWFFSDYKGLYVYSIPYDNQIKLAFHKMGPTIQYPDNYAIDDNSDNYEVQLRDFLGIYLPQFKDSPLISKKNFIFQEKKVCQYTMADDDNFIIDFLPMNKNIILMSPCSGHGFKFSILLGLLVTRMVQTEQVQVQQFQLIKNPKI